MRPRLQAFFVEAIEGGGGPKAVARALGAFGIPVKERTVASWREGRYFPGTETAAALSVLTGVSFDRHVRGEAPESTFADQLADHEERLTEQEEWLRELYSSLGLEMGASVSAQEVPNLALARLRRDMEELRGELDRRLGGQ